MKPILVIFGLLIFSNGWAAEDRPNYLAVSQGISSPTITSNINFSTGTLHENPVGNSYQTKTRISGLYDTGDTTNDGYGAEFGTGNGRYGIAVGYYQRDCTTCDEVIAGALSGTWGGFGAGLRFQEDLFTFGTLFNPFGQHRFGLVAGYDTSAGSGNEVTSYGAGYSFVGRNYTVSIDASKLDTGVSTIDDIIYLTPGVAVHLDFFSLSVSYDMHLQDDTNINNDEVWFGLGIGTGDTWHIAVYSDYVNEISAAASFFF